MKWCPRAGRRNRDLGHGTSKSATPGADIEDHAALLAANAPATAAVLPMLVKDAGVVRRGRKAGVRRRRAQQMFQNIRTFNARFSTRDDMHHHLGGPGPQSRRLEAAISAVSRPDEDPFLSTPHLSPIRKSGFYASAMAQARLRIVDVVKLPRRESSNPCWRCGGTIIRVRV